MGTISTASGRLYRTYDGIAWFGPTTVNLIAFAENADLTTGPASAE